MAWWWCNVEHLVPWEACTGNPASLNGRIVLWCRWDLGLHVAEQWAPNSRCFFVACWLHSFLNSFHAWINGCCYNHQSSLGSFIYVFYVARRISFPFEFFLLTDVKLCFAHFPKSQPRISCFYLALSSTVLKYVICLVYLNNSNLTIKELCY